MSVTQKVDDYLLQNPGADPVAAAAALDTTRGFVNKRRHHLRKEGRLPAYDHTVRRRPPDTHAGLQEECEKVGIPLNSVGHYWYKGQFYSILAKTGEKNYFDLQDEIMGQMKRYAPKYPKLKYQKIKDGHLLVIDPADVHLNKLCSAFETGDAYDIEVAEQRIMEGVQGILDKVQGFKISQILFISGNDKLHVDTPRSTTTSGTFQDTQLMWYDAYVAAVRIERSVLELLLQVAPVHYQYDPSNHDYTNGFFMAQTVAAWFSKCKDITFDVSISHRKYYRFHENLIASTHGDGAKEQDLPLLMAHEAPKDWGECKHRYVYTHHIHHKKSKDYMSVCVESLRSPSGTDSWHHRNGYQHAPKAIEGFLHHPKHGQIARITHLF
jgi:hypothetical protein